MKFTIALLALVALAYTAPQPRKLFHEHYEDFASTIANSISGDRIGLLEQYLEFDEFNRGLEYLGSDDFYNLLIELENLPEFLAVVDFLEGHNIDITYFLDFMNSAFEEAVSRKARQAISGKDFSSYLLDSINLFPKEELIALYNAKYEEDESFRNAMDDFDSEEWAEIFNALKENETFQAEVSTLLEYGIDVFVMLTEMKATMGRF